eukprot:12891820-Prorocentrum_lima.AAC.1
MAQGKSARRPLAHISPTILPQSILPLIGVRSLSPTSPLHAGTIATATAAIAGRCSTQHAVQSGGIQGIS